MHIILPVLLVLYNVRFGSQTAEFGLTARNAIDHLISLAFQDHNKVFHSNSESRVERDDLTAAHKPLKTMTNLCQDMGLSSRQMRMCRKDSGVPHALIDGFKRATLGCEEQFKFQRWNCSSKYRHILLRKELVETAFIFSISSAGLTAAIAESCSKGLLETCHCDDPGQVKTQIENQWRWGGCGDNIDFGAKFTRRFLRDSKKNMAMVDLKKAVHNHNSNLGVKTVIDNMTIQCKCHGVSAACTVKTCWRQMSTFQKVASTLKEAYNKAVRVDLARIHKVAHTSSKRTTKTLLVQAEENNLLNRHDKGKVARSRDMVFVEGSPNFCDQSVFGPGTSGRVCDPRNNTCSVLCCGRGYNSQPVLLKRRCKCTFKWCCEVVCSFCPSNELVYTCK